MIGIGLVFWGGEIFKFRKLKCIIGNVTVSFWYFKIFREKVDLFIVALQDARKQYFRENYLTIDDQEDPEDILHRIQWLRSAKYITPVEYKDWLAEVERLKWLKKLL